MTAEWTRVEALARRLVDAWGAWAPMLTPDGRRVAYVSDRTGVPRLWVQDVADADSAVLVGLSDDPVVAVSWSPDAQWLGCAVATGGGVRTEVWVVRPDGRGARRIAGGTQNATLGPWARDHGGLVVTLSSDAPDVPNECVLIDPVTDARETIAHGALIDVLDLTGDGRFALLRDGTRGAHFCRLVDRAADIDHPVLPHAETGSTDVGLLRPAPPSHGEARQVAYLVTDAGRPRRELLAIGVHDDGHRIAAGTLAARDDAEAEFADADDAGALVLVVWNVHGRSELELIDAASGQRRACALPDGSGEVVSGVVLTRDGASVVASIEGPTAPRRLWRMDVASGGWAAVTPSSLADASTLVRPELVHFLAHDGLELSGWLYCCASVEPPPAMISLHGGPESQERPTFSPQHQVLAAAGFTVLAPNIRGSSGFGHAFVHADDRYGRFDALRDVADCARVLAERGWADPARIAVTGRSYGGYATLMALVRHAPAFAAGVDICGMSDLNAFFRDTEPWIAAAAVSKYGDPARDGALLAELSPLHQIEAVRVPLLVVHGELDTNVPLTEATRLVARLHGLGRDVEYLELVGEGHEYRRADSRLVLLRRLTDFLTRTLAPVPLPAPDPAPDPVPVEWRLKA